MIKKIKELRNTTKEKSIQYYKKIIEIIFKPEMGVLPGQIAFSMILSIVPIITLLGFTASFFGIDMDSIVELINSIVPGGASSFTPFLTGNTIDLGLALIFIWVFYLASSGCNSIILISNQIYGINQSNWIKRRIKALFMTISILVVLLFIILVPVFGEKLLSLLASSNITENAKRLYGLFKGPFLWIIMFIFIRAFYEFSPDRARRTSHLNTGALFTTVGWIIVTEIYSHLATNMTNYNLFYGALSNIAFLMLWLYYISYIFVIGLSLNYGEEQELEIKEQQKYDDIK